MIYVRRLIVIQEPLSMWNSRICFPCKRRAVHSPSTATSTTRQRLLLIAEDEIKSKLT
jgi:hypothetical protein